MLKLAQHVEYIASFLNGGFSLEHVKRGTIMCPRPRSDRAIVCYTNCGLYRKNELHFNMLMLARCWPH